jgi:ATP phosphoribosyltransferase
MSGSGNPVRVALPRGDLRAPLAQQLAAARFTVPGYGEAARTYRFEVEERPGVVVRVFSDADIPIQVALGQYDLGVASRAWVDELLVRYRHESIVPLRPLDLPGEPLVLAGVPGATLESLACAGSVRVATEFPNVAHHLLNRLRVPDYRVFDVWAQAEAWPPDDADLALAPAGAVEREGLAPLLEVHTGGVWLIANREALASRNLGAALEPLLRLPRGRAEPGLVSPEPLAAGRRSRSPARPPRESFRIAVPDGHAQRHTVAALAEAGLAFVGYGEKEAVRRPVASLPGAGVDVEVKVMRPQDMPRAVALGCFDLALTGRDWLTVHRATFPSAPVVELCDLRRSRYRLGAVVSEDLPAETIEEAVAWWRRDDPTRAIRVASEYASLADDYARDRHLGRYRVIPISGASEGFVPEDAEILVEGTETGTTLTANRLRMIDVIMESTNCAIGSPVRPPGRRGELRDEIVERLRAAAEAAA